MESINQQWMESAAQALDDLQQTMVFDSHHLLVIGCSTSEVIGNRIGTSGSEQVAEALFQAFNACHQKTGIHLAFQCCEHLNRALVVTRETAEKYHLEEVCVRPVRHAGGAMAAYAFDQLTDPAVVETIQADGGIDIGDTLIGMQLKRVAVPVRSRIRAIGSAHLVMARTRPKLIGGERAVYPERGIR